MKTDIYEMAESNMISEMEKLIKKNVDLNIKDEFGYSPLHLAISNEHEDMALLLLGSGADGNIQDNNGFTPLHYAAEYRLYEVAAAILGNNPEALHIANKHGNQPLWTAIFNADKQYKLVKLLLSFNANINYKNKVDKSPLDMAKGRSNNELVNLLLGS